MSSFWGLPDEKKNIIWVLSFMIGDFEGHVTGFSVTDAGHIMTTAHSLCRASLNSVIKARRLDQDTVNIAQVVMIKQNWNLAILKINKKTPYGELSSDGNLAAEQPLLYIGNPDFFMGRCLYGNVSFPCVDVKIPTDDDLVCKTYQSNQREEKSTYRVMGHVFNKSYFKKNRAKTYTPGTEQFIMGLHPLIPIVQTNGLCSKDDILDVFGGWGLEGGPMFDTNGQIVGMMFTNEEHSQLGIHVSLLKYFMQLCQLRPNMV